MMNRWKAYGFGLLTLLTGCSDSSTQPTSWYNTGSIYAYMTAKQDQSGLVSTTVQLRNGPTSSAAYLYLSDGETLYSSLDKPPSSYLSYSGDLFSSSIDLSNDLKVMKSRNLFIDHILFTHIVYGEPEYFAQETPSSGTLPTRAYVGFERDGQVWAGESSIDIPPAFQILTPVAYSTLSRSTPIVLSWSNTDASTSMALEVAADCIDGTQFVLTPTLAVTVDPATGISSATLDSSNYFDSTVAAPSQTCQIVFLLERVRLGGVTSSFAGGSFQGIQQRTVQFTSVP